MSKSIQELIAEARAQIENLEVDEQRPSLDLRLHLVDIREPQELAELGAIPGAVHIPKGTLDADPAQLDPSRRVILYCAGGNRSALSTVLLQQHGFENVAHLGGGFGAWAAAGKPVEPAS